MIYRFIAFLLGMTGDIFYRRVTLGHTVPEEGPVLILANHPNALADPVVLARITPRPQRALAKEPLFHFPVFSWVLRGVGAIPVFRAQDGFDTNKNDRVFDAVLDTLEKGEVITLFPASRQYIESKISCFLAFRIFTQNDKKKSGEGKKS